MVTMVKMHLLLVDDEQEFLDSMKKVLLKRGCAVRTAASGEECLRILAAELVHVVILDVRMPGMDGVETLRQIKQLFPMVEVIMLTGHATVDSAIEGLKLGALEYLMKPAQVDDLLAKAEKAFRRRLEREQTIKMAEALKRSDV